MLELGAVVRCGVLSVGRPATSQLPSLCRSRLGPRRLVCASRPSFAQPSLVQRLPVASSKVHGTPPHHPRATHLLDIEALLNQKVVVLESDLAVARGVGVRVGDGAERVVQAGRVGLDLLGEAVEGKGLGVGRAESSSRRMDERTKRCVRARGRRKRQKRGQRALRRRAHPHSRDTERAAEENHGDEWWWCGGDRCTLVGEFKSGCWLAAMRRPSLARGGSGARGRGSIWLAGEGRYGDDWASDDDNPSWLGPEAAIRLMPKIAARGRWVPSLLAEGQDACMYQCGWVRME